MKATRWLIGGIGCMAFALTSCSGSKAPTVPEAKPPAPVKVETNPRVLILGKWVPTQPGREAETVEFAKDGTLSSPGLSPGKYKFLDDQTIEYEKKLVFDQQLTKAKVKVDKDTLTLDIVDAKSRTEDGAAWEPKPNDLERKGKQEKFKRAP
jgi:hypothetical protein